jgi:starch synthase
VHIVFAASECAPFAKSGGLAEVVAALPRELVKQGHRVTVYLPLYQSVRPFIAGDLLFAIRSITIPFPGYNRFAGVVDGGERDGVQYYFIDCPELFERDGIYGPNDRVRPGAGDYADNAERFGVFCRAVIEAAKQLGVPEIFHAHDWPAAMIPVLLRTVYYFDPALRSAATVLTIHNTSFQGFFPPAALAQMLLPWDLFSFDKLEDRGRFNWLKGGVVYSDYLTTVSPTYAAEIQTREYGAGLEGALARRGGDLRGVLNGVDYALWDPAHDPKLAAHYGPDRLEGKLDCRKDLLHAFGLRETPADAMVIGMVTRLATQKGLDFLVEISDRLTERNVALVVLGSGEMIYEEFLRNLAARKPNQVAVQIKYDNALAHKIHAGADVFLMPSRYEPGGLNQMYALKYGTAPVVRATGGLKDTVEEWNLAAGSGTGFLFEGYNSAGLLAALDRALAAFADRASWETLMRNGMAKSYTWEHAATEYAEVYHEVLRRRG